MLFWPKGLRMTSQDDFFDYLILQGAVTPEGIDQSTGEILYSFTDKLKEINEDMFNRAMDTFHNDIMLLWEYGFFNINWMEENPVVKVTEKINDQDEIQKLPIDLQRTLLEVLRMMKR
jgi:hypothetical protein